MKKIISTLLTVTLVIGMMLTLTSCGEKQPETPKGYELYENDYFSFAYPEEWELQKGSVTIIYDQSTGSNINIMYEEKTDEYDNLDAQGFTEFIKESLAGTGGSFSDVYAQKYETVNAELNTVTYIAKLYGITYYQTALIVTTDDRTYSIAVTCQERDVMKDTVQTILDTFYVKDDRTFFEKVSDTVKETFNKE